MAEKCDRFGTRSPVAWTAAIRPSIHCCSSGARSGCSPNRVSFCSRLPSGTAIEPRRPRYAGSPYGTTTLMPSTPPRRLSTTTTLLSRLRAEDRLAEDPAERRVCDAECTGADQALQHASPRDSFGARELLAHLVAVIGAVRVSVSGVGAGEGSVHRVMCSGVSRMAVSSRGIIQPTSWWSASTISPAPASGGLTRRREQPVGRAAAEQHPAEVVDELVEADPRLRQPGGAGPVGHGALLPHPAAGQRVVRVERVQHPARRRPRLVALRHAVRARPLERVLALAHPDLSPGELATGSGRLVRLDAEDADGRDEVLDRVAHLRPARRGELRVRHQRPQGGLDVGAARPEPLRARC